MRYIGGKHRQGPAIAKLINHVLGPQQWYVEPFCGALGVASRVRHDKMLLADGSEALINMWKTLQDPSINLPDVVTEEQYQRFNATRDPGDWMTAYVGFGMSFGGMWFQRYTRDKIGRRDYAAELKRSANLKRSATGNAIFTHADYRALSIPDGTVIYCDPPYAGRSHAYDAEMFDHKEFWEWCRTQAQAGHTLLATEYTVPDDFVVLHAFGDTVARYHMVRPAGGTNEVLVCHESQRHLWEEHTSVR